MRYIGDKLEEALQLYIELENAKEVGRILDLNPESIVREAKKRGLSTNDRSFSRKCRQDIPYLDEKAISDDRHMGYICGLIASDGNLGKDGKTISLELSREDSSVVEWISSLVLNTPTPLRESHRVGRVPTVVFRRQLPLLYQYCLDMGITPKKSLTLDVNLEGKSEEFLWHFLRGVIDGDGCISVGTQDRPSNSSIRIASASLTFLETLQSIFGGTITKQSCYMLQFKGKLSKQLALKLPVNPEYMTRKTIKLESIQVLDFFSNRLNSVLTGSIWGVYDKPKSIIQLWRETDMSIPLPTVRWRMKHKGLTFEEAVSY